MRLHDVGQVLAERILELDEGTLRSQVRVLIGAPKYLPGTSDFYCPYQVLGLSDDTVRYTGGVDAAQALYLAMEAVGTWLAATPEARSGRLSWYGERSLGFPVREQRPNLRLVV
jgi:hypothetical protein